MTLPLQKSRVQSIDLLRGLVMIIMALDHARDFFHAATNSGIDPLDFSKTSPVLFLTRWITHFCAPVFVFLSGTSIYFVSQRKTKQELSRFLFTRGIWLMIMELTIVYFGWEGTLSYLFFGAFVIWVLGLSMVVLSVLIFLPRILLLILSLVIVFGHNLLDPFDANVSQSLSGFLYSVLHVPHEFVIDSKHTFLVLYPLLPWVGVMALGIFFGELYKPDISVQKRKKILLQLGLGTILLFVILRSGNFYGESFHWKTQSTEIFTLLSFINTTKYPPSLLYLLMTIGPGMLFLAFAEQWKNKLTSKIIVYGRVPFFYYILHIYLLHAIALVIFFANGHQLSELNHGKYLGGFGPGNGIHLWQTYLLWMGAVVLLYFPCRWYNNYKSTHTNWWLSYL